MDNKLRTTLVAAAVSSVLSSTAFAASDSLPAKKALQDFDYNASLAQKAPTNNKLRAPSNLKPVNSLSQGIKRQATALHYDKTLNTNTFSWATDEQRIAPVPFNVLNRKSAIQQATAHFANTNGNKHGVTSDALNKADLKQIHDTGRGALVTKYQQKLNEIEVYGHQFNVMLNQDMELIATSGYFSKAKLPRHSLATQFEMPSADAINLAISDMGGSKVSLIDTNKKGQYSVFEVEANKGKFDFSSNPRAKKVYYPSEGVMIPAYYVEVMASEKGQTKLEAYRYVISAKSGQILKRNNMIQSDAFTYRVFADASAPYAPYDSPMGNDLSPHPTGVATDVVTETVATMNDVTIENAGISTNDPWLPPTATSTIGFNVIAYADVTAPRGYNAPGEDENGNPVPGDLLPEITSANTFGYQFTQGDAHTTTDNMSAAVVNLFYVNNYMHDVYYDHGFDEAAGNAQFENYGRGGIAGDPLLVEAQDYSGENNANMATPADGASPVMQMYIFAEPVPHPLTLGSMTDVGYAHSRFSTERHFQLDSTVVRANDATQGSHLGCEEPVNGADLAGKVAVFDRGDCNFWVKVLNAQNAGAVGAIIVNNDVDNPDAYNRMPGSPSTSINIPAIMISNNSGAALYEEMAQGDVSFSLQGSMDYRDGTLDNAIVEHEWGHYISNRLTNLHLHDNSQGSGMGEGWGDFIALMTLARDEDRRLNGNKLMTGIYNVGAYALNNGNVEFPYYFGIRRVPYTTNMELNGLTFKHIQDQVALPDHHPVNGDPTGSSNARVHSTGEVWASMLWESYTALINRVDLRFQQAEDRMMDYIVAGLKMTPPAPTLTEARDAILAAARAQSEADYQTMRAAFAKRGMGPAAVSPARFDPGYDGSANSQGHAGVVEDFNTEHSELILTEYMMDNQHSSANGSFCDNDNTLDVGETSALKFHVRNHGTTSLTGVKAMLSSTADVTFGNGGVVSFDDLPQWNNNAAGMIEVTLNSAGVNEQIPLTITFMSDDPNAKLPEPWDEMIWVNRDIAKDPERMAEGFDERATFHADWRTEITGDPVSTFYRGLDDWMVVSDPYGFGTGNIVWGPDSETQTDMNLITPMVTVGDTGEFALDFIHYYQFEGSVDQNSGDVTYWDGGVMEVSIDGGEWTDVVAAGGSFATGYNGTLDTFNPYLSGRDAFVGNFAAGWIDAEKLTFPEGVLNGHEVEFRFRIGSDLNTGQLGWIVDNVQFTNITNSPWSGFIADAGSCTTSTGPDVTTQPMTAVEGQTDMVSLMATVGNHTGNLSYHWTQTKGPQVMLDDPNAEMPMFHAPMVSKHTVLEFMVEVTDDNGTAHAAVEVTMENTLPPMLHIGEPSRTETWDSVNPELWEGPIAIPLDFMGAETGSITLENITVTTSANVEAVIRLEGADTNKPTVWIDKIGGVFGDGTVSISIAEGLAVDADGMTSNGGTSAEIMMKKYYE